MGAAAAAPPPGRRSFLNRTTVIVAAVLAVLVGAGGAGAAYLTSNDDDGPSGTPPVAGSQVPGAPGGAANSSAPSGAEQISMSATGDIVMGMAPSALPPNNGKGFFDPVKDLLVADLRMGNLEQVISNDTGVGKCSADSAGKTCFAFRTPPATVQNLVDGGFQLVNLANNHANDFGDAGLKNTRTALEGVGIKHTGAPGQITVTDVKGVKAAVVGFASYKWSNLCSDIPASTKIITDAAGQADIVVVQVHMGAEGSDKTHVKPGTEIFLGEDRCDPIKFSHAVIDAGADLVVGHGPHVVRGMEFYKGRLIAYSLGNFGAYKALGYQGVVGTTAVIKVNLKRDGSWVGGNLISTKMVGPTGGPAPDPAGQALKLIGELTKSDFPQTGAKFAQDGAISP
ncbi:CapA family protein [Virgisporangium aliadipatigenens]